MDGDIFSAICLSDSDDESADEDAISVSGNPSAKESNDNKETMDWSQIVLEKYENKIKILDRETFNTIQRPIFLSFSYFRDKFNHQSTFLSNIYQLALEYGDRIEFIVGDCIDIDLMYPHMNVMEYFYALVDPSRKIANRFAIDEKKRIFAYCDVWHMDEPMWALQELCDNLLNGQLYPSQAIGEICHDGVVKICSHLSYDALVSEVSRDVLLIVEQGDYKKDENQMPNYEQVARMAALDKVDVVYLNAEKNFVPFHLHVNSYPSWIFIPCNDKNNFLQCPAADSKDITTLIDFIKQNIGLEGATWRHEELLKQRYQPFDLPLGKTLHFEDLPSYMDDRYPKSFKLLDRHIFKSSKRSAIIFFMDFQRNGLSFYLPTLQKIHQVAQAIYDYETDFYIAEIHDIDLLYPEWYVKNCLPAISSYDHLPKVFARDELQRLYEVPEPATITELFFLYQNIDNMRLFKTQPKPKLNSKDSIATCVALGWDDMMKCSKSHIFLTLYWPSCKESQEVLNILEKISKSVRTLNVTLYKMNAQQNYVPLAFKSLKYPVHFFIPHNERNRRTSRFISKGKTAEEFMDFIRKNVKDGS